MKRWPKRTIVAVVACIFVLLGMTPLVCLCWWGSAHDLKPLSMALPLMSGEHASPFFETDLNDAYQIDIGWDGSVVERMELDLDWRVVDDGGIVIQQGTYHQQLGGNSVTLGHFRPKQGRQRIILRNRQHAEGMDTAHPRLEVSLPERSLEMAYGSLLAVRLAGLVSGPGVLILFALRWNTRVRRFINL